MWDDDEWPYEAAITVIPQNAHPFSIHLPWRKYMYKNDRAEDFVIEKRVPVIFTVVGVEMIDF